MTVYGIDPGLKGGVAWIHGGSGTAREMPLKGGVLDIREVTSWLQDPEHSVVYIERQQSMPQQGVASTFTIGVNYGMLLGALTALSVPYVEVRPRAWKDKILAGTTKDKDAAILHVQNRWPGVDMCPGRKRKPHDGIADAVCIAEFGWKAETGGKESIGL